jgi:hypothetical protein
MNKVTTAKYADLVNLATGVKKTIEDLNGKCNSFFFIPITCRNFMIYSKGK